MIVFPCLACGKKLNVKDELAGKRGKCPGCGKPITVPVVTEDLAAASAEPGKISPAPSSHGGGGVSDERTLPPRQPPVPPATAEPPSLSRGSAGPAPPAPVPAEFLTATVCHRESAASGYPAEWTDFLAPAQAQDEIGRLGPYRILKVLGAGGMGVVYQAEDPKLKRKVALKAMLPTLATSESSRQRFVREAQSAAALKHDHIVTIFQVDEDRGIPFLAMEFLEGEPLDVRLQREAVPPLADTLRICREVAEGLQAAHERGLIHRDIKPGNIWLEGKRARAKILDFGLARAAGGDSQLTQQGAIVGTPAYMAPEQANGKVLDGRADLFSLGCMLYRMCTGKAPFQGVDTLSTLMAVASTEPPPPCDVNPAVPAALSELVMRLLAKEPEGRPQSAEVVAAELAAIETMVGQQAPLKPAKSNARAQKPTTSYHAAPRGKRRPLWIAAGGVVLLLLAVVGTVFLLRPRDNRGSTAPGSAVSGAPEVKQPGPQPPALDEAWLKSVAAMSPEDQLKSVAAELKRRNPGFDGELRHHVENGVIVLLDFSALEIVDLAPVRALTELQTLKCYGNGETAKRGKLANLAPLQGMKLTALWFFLTEVKDLSPLKDMKQLTNIHCANTNVTDLSPLRGMNLDSLDCDHTQVSDLTPLKDMRLTLLGCGATRVSSLSPLSEMKLNVLHFYQTEVADLTPLKSMRITDLNCGNARVADLTILRGMPLKTLWCDFKPERDAEILRSIRTLESINGKEALAFWKEVDARPDRPSKHPASFKNSLGMEFVLVPKGKSWLGGGGGKPGDKEVEFVQDFYLGKYEVTQEEWAKVTGANPSYFSRSGARKDAVKDIADGELKRFPVESVSWDDAQLFLGELNKRDKQKGWLYRLPKEAEWEFACRGGLSTKYATSFDFYFKDPTNLLLPEQANFEHDNGLKRTCKVGSYTPNRLGLYDMHGNVYEWCDDQFDSKDPANALHRVVRSGAWFRVPGYCRAARRYAHTPSSRFDTLGLRVARVPVGKEAK